MKSHSKKKLVAELFAPEILTDTCQNVDWWGNEERES